MKWNNRMIRGPSVVWRNTREILLAAGIAGAITIQGAGVAHADFLSSESWFQAQGRAERTELQTALYWTGDYNGPIDARFGPLTYTAVQAFQERYGSSPSGVLTGAQQARLAVEASWIRRVVNRHLGRRGAPRQMVAAPPPVRYYAPSYQTVLILP